MTEKLLIGTKSLNFILNHYKVIDENKLLLRNGITVPLCNGLERKYFLWFKILGHLHLGHCFFIFCFTDFFRNKLGSEDEIKIKIKFIRTIFQLN